ncbi:choice-of-anchor J domain-containing protein [uncultured Dokdonia sp.]|uniref:T9SS-dependent choice-of-anchor J family protein n=1 Tax=uncultured Dokdonia sp. TaxID=575653 RepID=UPI002602EB78|nr:choice-of-anchor J domain-containing protein [uncultured Dokdonia sp.]
MKKITFLIILLFTLTINAQIIIDEGFDDITTLTDYSIVNASDMPGTNFVQGIPDTSFPAFDGEPNSYIAANFMVTDGTIMDLYLISPELILKNGDVISFFTRTIIGSAFPDRLEVRLDPDGGGVNPTTGDNGSFTELLLSINPDLEVGGYPEDWEKQTIVVSGLTGEVTTRFALRYWATDAGPVGNNSNIIGIDRLVVDTTLSTDEFSATNFTYLYNVNNSELQLNATAPMQNVKVFNVLGQEIINRNLSNTEETVSLSNISNGIYITQVTIGNTTETFKFVKR